MTAPAIELRFARPGDAGALRRLAELDSAPELAGQVVLALIDGDPVAALSLLDRRVVANPFLPTHQAVELLSMRARHLSGALRTRRTWPILRLRSA